MVKFYTARHHINLHLIQNLVKLLLTKLGNLSLNIPVQDSQVQEKKFEIHLPCCLSVPTYIQSHLLQVTTQNVKSDLHVVCRWSLTRVYNILNQNFASFYLILHAPMPMQRFIQSVKGQCREKNLVLPIRNFNLSCVLARNTIMLKYLIIQFLV